MASAYLADDLITAIREEGMLPSADAGGAQDTRLRAHLNRAQRLYLMRLLLSVREEYRTAYVDITLESGQTEVRIPSRAVGAALVLVETVDGQGSRNPLTMVGASRQPDDAAAGGPGQWYLRDNVLVLVSAAAAGTTLRLHYPRRFNKIVAATATREITAFDPALKTITIAAKPSDFTALVTYDLIQGSPHFDLLGSDLTLSAAASTLLTFTDALPDDLAVGDYVALAGQTPICQAPVELHDVLMQRALMKYLESNGDPKAATAEKTLAGMRDDALSLLSPRTKDASRTLLNFDAPGWASAKRRRR